LYEIDLVEFNIYNLTYPEAIKLRKMSALELLCNSLCGPWTKSLETPDLG